jgi:hypothetical protein
MALYYIEWYRGEDFFFCWVYAFQPLVEERYRYGVRKRGKGTGRYMGVELGGKPLLKTGLTDQKYGLLYLVPCTLLIGKESVHRTNWRKKKEYRKTNGTIDRFAILAHTARDWDFCCKMKSKLAKDQRSCFIRSSPPSQDSYLL